ncbi:hypothetical protein GIB67_019866 [Kingdonia uniflora]|uniref:Retrotransposon gag domain-containing protein n=1 Tax=Kingdonia uniflora TaxID=39325 RepID=A0A7J7MKP1_9MAGN|nr:hypothetical protein GIB67_019866 [Kingdonia uniflora]
MVNTWLLNSLSNAISESIIYASTAQEIWTEFQDRYKQSNGPRIYQLRCKIALYSQDNLSIIGYFTKLKSLWDELSSLVVIPTCSCGIAKAIQTYQQQFYLTKFLMGLHESYSAFRGQVLAMEPLPTVNKAYSFVLQEEKQYSLTTQPPSLTESASLTAFSNTRNQHLPSRDSNDQSKPRGNQHLYPTCDHYGWVGHTKEKCFSSMDIHLVIVYIKLGTTPRTTRGSRMPLLRALNR